MSALPPKADIGKHCGDVRFVQKQTFCAAVKSPYSITSWARARSVGETFKVERFSRSCIDDQFKFVACTRGHMLSFLILYKNPTYAHELEHSLVERNVGFLDHWTPFFRFGLKQRCKFFWCRTGSHHADVLQF
jgi:hypothetical protein